jgi:hypothetical protein
VLEQVWCHQPAKEDGHQAARSIAVVTAKLPARVGIFSTCARAAANVVDAADPGATDAFGVPLRIGWTLPTVTVLVTPFGVGVWQSVGGTRREGPGRVGGTLEQQTTTRGSGLTTCR